MKEVGVYIHIPFCKQKCYYCDFKSYANKMEKIDEYIKFLIIEIKEMANKIKIDCEQNQTEQFKIKTIYIGGGTPSVAEASQIGEILETVKNNFLVEKEAEITIEVNPGTVDENKLKQYSEFGINRLSIGLQETDNNLLKSIGRIHTYESFLQTYNSAQNVGFTNINVDLIIGLPNQTINNVCSSIEKILLLQPKHISVYSLIVEEGTKLSQMIQDEKMIELSDETERKMYWYVKNTLEEHGYHHYEISNFAQTGYESKHNLDCWEQHEYLGFGVASHSYMKNIRYSNINEIEDYIGYYKRKEFNTAEKQKLEFKEYLEFSNYSINEIQNPSNQMREYMLLGLRKIDGIKISEFKNKFIKNPIYVYKNELEKLIKENLIEVNEDNIKLTKTGIDFANIVWEEFI